MNIEDIHTILNQYYVRVLNFKQFKEGERLGLAFYVSRFDREEDKIIPCVQLIQFMKNQDGSYEIKNTQQIKGNYNIAWGGEGMWIISKLLKLSDVRNIYPL